MSTESDKKHADHVYTAMCAWEWCLEVFAAEDLLYLSDQGRKLESMRDQNGINYVREACQEYASVIEEHYQKAVEAGFDDSFDWEFIPWFMERKTCIDDGDWYVINPHLVTPTEEEMELGGDYSTYRPVDIKIIPSGGHGSAVLTSGDTVVLEGSDFSNADVICALLRHWGEEFRRRNNKRRDAATIVLHRATGNGMITIENKVLPLDAMEIQKWVDRARAILRSQPKVNRRSKI